MRPLKTIFPLAIFAALQISFLSSCDQKKNSNKSKLQTINTDGIMFALLRNVTSGVTEKDKNHDYALMDFNPFSENFGDTLQTIKAPLGHHGYVSPINGSLYVTQTDRMAARVDVSILASGLPKIQRVRPALEDNGMRVGEDIVWFKENGQDRYAVTSLDGDGDSSLGGICVYDANTDELVRTIKDSIALRYTHGISIFDDKPIGLVASVIHEDIALYGIPSVDSLGRDVTLVNFATGEVIKKYDLGVTEQGFPVAPVECMIFRKSIHEAFQKNEKALVVEMVGGKLVSAKWNEKKQEFDDFTTVYSPQGEKEYFPLEIYVDSLNIYVTYAEKVKVFDLMQYANADTLIANDVEYITKSCAHHLSFFDIENPETGKDVPVLLVQQNLLNLGQQSFNIPFALPLELGSHEVTAYNRNTGEILNTINIYEKYNAGIEYIGGITEDAYAHHH